jgi:hypothetical protein
MLGTDELQRGRVMLQARTDVRKMQICIVVKLVKGREIYITSMRFVHHLLRGGDGIMRVSDCGIRKGNPHRSLQHNPDQRGS